MPRLLFEKTGNAVWISHLDLMRLFQRAFKRAGFNLKHTQGFSQRPVVSIALPLSVGVESHCELLDFELVGDAVSNGQVLNRLNAVLVEGVRVLDAYDEARKIGDIALLDCAVILEYDAGIPEGCANGIRDLFSGETLMVEKRGKNGPTEQNIIPMIRAFNVQALDGNTLQITARICCQNPTLNPAQIPAAIYRYAPQWAPDFSRCLRQEIYDINETIFR